MSYYQDEAKIDALLQEMRDKNREQIQQQDVEGELELSMGGSAGVSLLKSSLTDPVKAYLKDAIMKRVPDSFKSTVSDALDDIQSGENPIPNLVKNTINDTTTAVKNQVQQLQAKAESTVSDLQDASNEFKQGVSQRVKPFRGSAEDRARQLRDQAFDQDPEVDDEDIAMPEPDIDRSDVFRQETVRNEDFGQDMDSVPSHEEALEQIRAQPKFQPTNDDLPQGAGKIIEPVGDEAGDVAGTAAAETAEAAGEATGESVGAEIGSALADEAPELAAANSLDEVPIAGELIAGASGLAVLGTSLYFGLKSLFHHHSENNIVPPSITYQGGFNT